jgi:hypothetical protein
MRLPAAAAAQQSGLVLTPNSIYIDGHEAKAHVSPDLGVIVSGKTGGKVWLHAMPNPGVSLTMHEAEVDIGATAESSESLPSSWVRVTHGGSWWSELEAYPKHANVYVEGHVDPGKPSPLGALRVTPEGVSVAIGDHQKDRAVLGATTLENTRTGSTEGTGPASLTLFDKQGKVLCRAP